jgi:cation diffusion facilitator family transporter
MRPLSRSTLIAEKRSVALVSVTAALVITALKLVTGVLSGSLGMLSEAAHSAMDLVAGFLTLFSVRVADKPPDDEHPYGHGRIENISAFVQTFLMLASCVWIVYEALTRIIAHKFTLELSIWPFLVLLLSIIVDLARSLMLRRTAEKSDSPALEAESTHLGTDVWSSVAVLIGLGCAWIGIYRGPHWLVYGDTASALAVACIILAVTYKLARRTINVLLDAVPEEEQRRIMRQLSKVEGVIDVEAVRLRRSGSNYFADVTLGLARTLTLQRSEQLARDATDAVRRVLPACEVMVKTVTRATGTEDIFEQVRAVASRHNLNVHDLSVQDLDGSLHVEQHIEVEETMPLRDAHNFVTALEAEIRHECHDVGSILTHIESRPAQIEHNLPIESNKLESDLKRSAREDPRILDVHDVKIRRVGDQVNVSLHCTLPDNLSMAHVHETITALETRFKNAAPEVRRVLIHPEPSTDNRR